MPSERLNQRYSPNIAPTNALKKSLRFFALAVILMGLISVAISRLFTEDVVIRAQESSRENLDLLWSGYKKRFINDGRVIRPKNEFDTVSEGQAYGMLRAVWQNDRPTFDAIYRWSEENLSRRATHGDHLLSWRYGSDKMGGLTVLDENPALDADLDYALSLFLAARTWPDGRSPLNTPNYREKALLVADSIMSKAVLLHPTGELALLPWPIAGNRGDNDDALLNPSYFSPGHYRVFEQESGNRRWGKLAADTYNQIGRILLENQGENRVVTVPDWITMRPDGSFVVDSSRGYVSGWDAFRLWWRLRLDYEIGGDERAARLIRERLLPFISKSMDESGGDVASESDRDGVPLVKYSNAGMTAVYRWATRDIAPVISRSLQRQAMRHLKRDGEELYFQDKDNYYINSWAWFAMLEGDLTFPFARFYNAGLKDSLVRETTE